jgi:dipeptidyl aminopeptidase/acylaminoacyl peptidase
MGGEYDFVKLSLPDCSVLETTKLDPDNDSLRLHRWTMSPKNDAFAYIGTSWIEAHGSYQIWVRDASTLKQVARMSLPTGSRRPELAYTPLGDEIVARASLRGGGEDADLVGTDRIFVFDARSGKEQRFFNTKKGDSGLAISPDGLLLATARKQEERRKGRRHVRSLISVYDFEAGEEIAIGEFPWRRAPENVPMSGMETIVRDISFTPDGKQLIAATSAATRIWDIPEGLVPSERIESRCTDCGPTEEPSKKQLGQAQEADPIEPGDKCHAYVVDIDAGREFWENFDEEDWARKSDEEKRAVAAELETNFDHFYPEPGEEELTTRTYPFPGADREITASVYYTDESMAAKIGEESHVLYSVFLCIAEGKAPYENACEAPGNAIAEVADTGYNVKSRVKTRVLVNGRSYSLGLECESPAALKALTERSETDNN